MELSYQNCIFIDLYGNVEKINVVFVMFNCLLYWEKYREVSFKRLCYF